MTQLQYFSPLAEFQRRHPNLGSIHALRRIIYNRENNGLGKFNAVKKRGGRWWVNELEFERWLNDGCPVTKNKL